MNINKSRINRDVGMEVGIPRSCLSLVKACNLLSCSDLVYWGQPDRNQPSSILISFSVFFNLFPSLSVSLVLKCVSGLF